MKRIDLPSGKKQGHTYTLFLSPYQNIVVYPHENPAFSYLDEGVVGGFGAVIALTPVELADKLEALFNG